MKDEEPDTTGGPVPVPEEDAVIGLMAVADAVRLLVEVEVAARVLELDELAMPGTTQGLQLEDPALMYTPSRHAMPAATGSHPLAL